MTFYTPSFILSAKASIEVRAAAFIVSFPFKIDAWKQVWYNDNKQQFTCVNISEFETLRHGEFSE